MLLATNAFGYDTASRLLTVSDGTNNATYAYLANSPLISQITPKSNTTTRQSDFLNRLQSISSSSSSAISFGYLYNDANQRIQRTESDASRWVYEYDRLGQVTSGKRYWSDGSIFRTLQHTGPPTSSAVLVNLGNLRPRSVCSRQAR